MLAVKTYPEAYVSECEARVASQLHAFDALAAAVPKAAAGALDAFAPHFLADLVVVLDGCFMHRTRAIEGKDGNPLNEVRMLAASILGNQGVLAEDKTIKYQAGTTALGLDIGDEIRLDPGGMRRLAAAYFAEIRTRFG